MWPIVRPQALALACCFLAALVGAAAAKLQQGLVYGASHAFYVEAPQGWILDNTAGVNQGLHAVFYPGGSRWEDAAAVIYVNTAPREPECDLAAFIKGDLEKFRNRHPNLKTKAGDSISTFDEKNAEVQYFTGDQWDNHEAVAYLQEEKVFVIIALTSRTEAAFRNSLDAFRSVVKSYHFLTSKPEDATDQFDLIKQIADDSTKTPDGTQYDKKHGQYFAARHSSTMKRCFETTPNPDPSNFDILIRVGLQGEPLDVIIRPETNIARCLRAAMTGDRYPFPPGPRYWVHVSMSIKQ